VDFCHILPEKNSDCTAPGMTHLNYTRHANAFLLSAHSTQLRAHRGFFLYHIMNLILWNMKAITSLVRYRQRDDILFMLLTLLMDLFSKNSRVESRCRNIPFGGYSSSGNVMANNLIFSFPINPKNLSYNGCDVSLVYKQVLPKSFATSVLLHLSCYCPFFLPSILEKLSTNKKGTGKGLNRVTCALL
jgi:hypothetical protein